MFKKMYVAFFLAAFLLGCAKKEEEGVDVIRVAFWGSAEEIKIIRDTIEPWDKKTPHIRVKLEHVPIGGGTSVYVARMLTQIAAGDAPDVMFMEAGLFVNFYLRDVLLDLVPFIEKDKEFDIDDFFPEIVKRFSRDGKVYIIPRDIAPFAVVYYNKDMLDKAGLPYPDDNWTWDDLVEYGQKLTIRNEETGLVEQFGFYAWAWPNFVYSAGGGLVDNVENPTKSVLNSKEAKKGLEFYNDLINKHKIMPGPGQLIASPYAMFEGGKIAMYASGIWETPRFRKIRKFDWDVAMFPGAPGGRRGFGISGSGYGIYRGTKHPESAWEVVKRLAGDEGQIMLAQTGLAQPANRIIAEGPYWAGCTKAPANKKMLNEAVKYSVFHPFHKNWMEVDTTIIGRETHLYFTGEQSLDKTVDNIVAGFDKALEKE